VILAAGTPQILLPWDNATVFERNLQGYGGGRLASWTVWIVPMTMAPRVAALRVGMAEPELRAVNNIPARVTIKAGSTLLVPRAASVQDDVTVQVADSGQIALSREAVTHQRTVKAGKHETVASIAKRYHVSIENVADWNKVKTSASFAVGQQVILFTAAPAAKAAGKPAAKGTGKPSPRKTGRAVQRKKSAAVKVAKR
jgi:membrane-bound lytic murein transglycosylase D